MGKGPLPILMVCVPSLELMWWKERIYSYKLSSGTRAHTHAQTHVHKCGVVVPSTREVEARSG